MAKFMLLKIDNSKKAAINKGKWKAPGAAFYDQLLNATYYQGGKVPEDAEELNKMIKEKKVIGWPQYLKEAYAVAPVDKISNSPHGVTPFSRSGCKYPHHAIKGDKLVVSIPGLRAAYICARNQGVLINHTPENKQIVAHFNRHFRELGLKPVWHHGGFYLMEESAATITENFDDIESFLMEKTDVDLGNVVPSDFMESCNVRFDDRPVGQHLSEYFKVLQSTLDPEYRKKGYKDLSIFKKVPITKELTKKYADQGKLVKWMRDQDPKYDDICYMWIDDNDNYVGAVTYDSKADKNGHVYISGIDVAYAYLGYGIGSQLLEEAIKGGANALNVQNDNEIALRMYRNRGFKISKESQEAINSGKSRTYEMFLDESGDPPTEKQSKTSALTDPRSSCKNPQELLEWMSGIQYGWCDSKGVVRGTGDDDDEELFYKEYHLQSIYELMQSKVGVCWDQAELERQWFCFYKIGDHFVPYAVIYLEIQDGEACPTHTFLVYKHPGQSQEVFWFENSWHDYRGIHQYPNIETCLRDIAKKHQECHKDHTSPLLVTNVPMPGKYRDANTCAEYMEHCRRGKKIDLNDIKYADIFPHDQTTASPMDCAIEEGMEWVDRFVHDDVFRESVGCFMEKHTSVEYKLAAFKKRHHYDPATKTIVYEGHRHRVDIDIDRPNIPEYDAHGKVIRWQPRKDMLTTYSNDEKGFPKELQIVLSKETFQLKSAREIDAVLAHEIGHYDTMYLNDVNDLAADHERIRIRTALKKFEDRKTHATVDEFEADKFSQERNPPPRTMMQALRRLNRMDRKQILKQMGTDTPFDDKYVEREFQRWSMYEWMDYVRKGGKLPYDQYRPVLRDKVRKQHLASMERDRTLRTKALKSDTMKNTDVYKPKKEEADILGEVDGEIPVMEASMKKDYMKSRHVGKPYTLDTLPQYLYYVSRNSHSVLKGNNGRLFLTPYPGIACCFMVDCINILAEEFKRQTGRLPSRVSCNTGYDAWDYEDEDLYRPLNTIRITHNVPTITATLKGRASGYIHVVNLDDVKDHLELNPDTKDADREVIYTGTKDVKPLDIFPISAKYELRYSEEKERIHGTGIVESVNHPLFGMDNDALMKYFAEEGEIPEDPPEMDPKKESLPKQTDKEENSKNGVRRKNLYIAFIEWAKEYNSRNTFGSVFDKDAFTVSYPFVPNEMRYFYRLANPLLCVLAGHLTFFPLTELRKINAKNQHLNEMMIFAATENDVRVFNIKDKKIYRGVVDANNSIELHEVLSDTFDTYIQKMVNRGDILNAPIEEKPADID